MINQNINPNMQNQHYWNPQLGAELLANFNATKAYEAEQAADAPTGPASTGPASTGSVDAVPASVPDYVGFSTDAVIAYFQARLNSLGSQMNQIFSSQQKNEAWTQDIDNIASEMNDLPGPSSGSSPTVSVQQPGDIEAAYNQAITDVGGPGTTLGAELQKDLNAFTNYVKQGNGSISSASLDGLTQNLKNYTSDLNSNSQMTEINLESLASQQGTAVEIATNLVQSFGQQATDIAKNIGT